MSTLSAKIFVGFSFGLMIFIVGAYIVPPPDGWDEIPERFKKKA
ncbi:hypothetical protein SAMN04488128_1011804 [Chitinophaga eiseniae]|uniref:Uncharacterized protein n=1 Tax=Chitinophaga eiseniae TaxID=634771 RepID=A0A1T4NYC3_9BACT|nr:hypothetical protein [Chitinophaga eiseniae]SJZ84067.1 hypothetical protein SAMN04488128_1011804 [Chitinophaga eiseniae]